MRQFLETCENAARAGGQVLLDWQGKIMAREKGPKDLVTEADLASQKVIQQTLLSVFPDHRFVGEEDGLGNEDQQSRHDGYCWICDPLDGTTNYVHQLPSFCVSIALQHDDELLVGVVFDPTSNECFSAVSGEGAFLNGQPIRVSDCTEMPKALVAVSLPPEIERDAPEIGQFLDVLVSSQALRRMGSAALNLSYLAAGRLDGYWASDTKIWDVAAGVLLVQEAGGEVSASRGGQFQLGTPGLLAASTCELSQELIALVTSTRGG
ncbi:MAG TPA: inositol monophosphatase family protein [Pirellulaceae bacterium]|jgi:myo-inositol-1(or 4)-monophosphatase|nr:inositol monophosphatase family protein [Pirellulaceae bacterium]